MPDQSNFLYRTNYFKSEWTWIRRSFAMLILGGGAFLLPFEPELQFLNPLFAGIVIFFFIAKPKDDLAVTKNLLLHIKRSAIPIFTRIDKYDISDIKSIRCGGIYSEKWELLSGGKVAPNTLELTLSNNRSKSLDFTIDRKKLDLIVKLVYEQQKEI
jgi:hypothetical protein